MGSQSLDLPWSATITGQRGRQRDKFIRLGDCPGPCRCSEGYAKALQGGRVFGEIVAEGRFDSNQRGLDRGEDIVGILERPPSVLAVK